MVWQGAALSAFDELKDATLSEFPAFKPHLFTLAFYAFISVL